MTAAHDHGALTHQAFPYDSQEAFVSALEPFARDGLECGDRVFAVTNGSNAAALHEALGADAVAVDFCDAAEWYRQPYRTLAAYDAYVARHGDGRRVRVIGEPVWRGRSAAAVREWARYESALNVAFASAPAWIVCPYDTSALPDDIVEHALRTHPDVLGSDGPRPSGRFTDPERFFDLMFAVDTAPPPPGAAVLAFEPEGYREMRRLVAAEAQAAGVPVARLDELVLAVNELVENASLYGQPPVEVRVWPDGDELVVEVEDGGNGFEDRLAGCVPPDGHPAASRGLWLVRQLCDSVEVARREGRFAVRGRVSRR